MTNLPMASSAPCPDSRRARFILTQETGRSRIRQKCNGPHRCRYRPFARPVGVSLSVARDNHGVLVVIDDLAGQPAVVIGVAEILDDVGGVAAAPEDGE